ncbi:MAG: EF-P lysine aminoacylase EpmA [Microgenomates group bacterium]
MKTWQALKQNPKLWDRYFVREHVIRRVRSFFDKEQFHEVETPLLLGAPAAESYLDVFETKLLDRDRKSIPAYLSTSPELALKKLIVAGIGNCYSITKSFRNMETDSHTHNPEFTILEWYRVGATYTSLMDDCKNMLLSINHALGNGNTLTYQGVTFDLAGVWEKITIKEAFQKWAGINFDEFLDNKKARSIAAQKGYTVKDTNTWEELYDQIYLNEIEPHLGKTQPTIIYEFPGCLAALSKKKKENPNYAERFEWYIGGLELGDCYTELTDWKEQQDRFDWELTEIKRLGKTTYDYDHDFIESLKVGMPDTSGIAVGLDRLIMLFADTTRIADTLFFPSVELFEK